jgi:hypothetical protein
VLDGPGQGGHTARTAAALAAEGLIPEVMLVAVPNLSDETRARDLTPPGLHQDHEKPDSPLGRGDAFLAFLRDELIPKVERDYRTAPFRMLAGHSRSGVFVLYSLIAEPALFDARFAHSAPVWREDEALGTACRDNRGLQEAVLAASSREPDGRVQLSVTGGPGARGSSAAPDPPDGDFVDALRYQDVTPHVAQNITNTDQVRSMPGPRDTPATRSANCAARLSNDHSPGGRL